ncbi:MAG: type II restriction enzyme [Thermoguttaceae bacterium]
MRKYDAKWETLFAEDQLLARIRNDGSVRVTAERIKQLREPRLMTKFDQLADLPTIFQDNGLAILPLSRREYCIAPFEAYHTLTSQNDTNVTICPLPSFLENVVANGEPRSEAISLNLAYASGMLSDFLGEEKLFPVMSGRMNSSQISFTIHCNTHGERCDHNLKVDNAQLEIDGGYEGCESLAVIEVKNRPVTDFIIRQLYFPYRRLSTLYKKTVRPVFLVCVDNTFRFYEYRFDNLLNYNSLKLIKTRRYSLGAADDVTAISLDDLFQYAQQVAPEKTSVPFPQADDISRVLNLCESLVANDLSKEAVASLYQFAPRQADYYANAGRFLGLIQKHNAVFSLTVEGRRVFSLPTKLRLVAVAEKILARPVFRDAFIALISKGILPPYEQLAQLISQETGLPSSSDTVRRRASTVAHWVNWIAGLQHL